MTERNEDDGTQSMLIPRRPQQEDPQQADPRAWPDPRELEQAEDPIPIAERG